MSIAREISLSELPSWLQVISDRLATIDFSSSWRVLAVYLASDAKKNFDQSKSPDGISWAPLKNQRSRAKDLRAAAKAAPGDSQRPLRDTGLLMASLTGGEGAQGHVQQISPSDLTWGTNIEYASVQNFGHTFPARERGPGEKPWVFLDPNGAKVFTKKLAEIKIPARPFIGINENSIDVIGKVLSEHVGGQLGFD